MIFNDSVPKLLNTNQVAELLGIKPHTLAVGRCDGSLTIPYFKINRSVRYSRDDVEAYVAERRIG
jgi:predicted site-specific integrase-resolvase